MDVTIVSETGGGFGWGAYRVSLSFEEAVAWLERLRGSRVRYLVGPVEAGAVAPVWTVLGRARPAGAAEPDVGEELAREGGFLLEFGVPSGRLSPAGFAVAFPGLALSRGWFGGAEGTDDGGVAIALKNGVRLAIEPVDEPSGVL